MLSQAFNKFLWSKTYVGHQPSIQPPYFHCCDVLVVSPNVNVLEELRDRVVEIYFYRFNHKTPPIANEMHNLKFQICLRKIKL